MGEGAVRFESTGVGFTSTDKGALLLPKQPLGATGVNVKETDSTPDVTLLRVTSTGEVTLFAELVPVTSVVLVLTQFTLVPAGLRVIVKVACVLSQILEGPERFERTGGATAAVSNKTLKSLIEISPVDETPDKINVIVSFSANKIGDRGAVVKSMFSVVEAVLTEKLFDNVTVAPALIRCPIFTQALPVVLCVNSRLFIVRRKPHGVLNLKKSESLLAGVHDARVPFQFEEVKPFVALKDGPLSPDPTTMALAVIEAGLTKLGLALVGGVRFHFTF
jgi:hypothetical protein